MTLLCLLSEALRLGNVSWGSVFSSVVGLWCSLLVSGSGKASETNEGKELGGLGESCNEPMLVVCTVLLWSLGVLSGESSSFDASSRQRIRCLSAPPTSFGLLSYPWESQMGKHNKQLSEAAYLRQKT